MNILALKMLGREEGWLVGAQGLVAHYSAGGPSEGGQWRLVPVPAAMRSENLYALDVTADGSLWVAGTRGLLARLDARGWHSFTAPHPFNLLAGADVNGDNHFTNDRPPGAPRNSGLGPNYAVFDMRLARRFKLGERANLQFTAEGFNIANRTNYSTVNNVVGANFASPFSVHGTSAVSPSQPLGYTAALPKREIQLGIRIDF